MLSLLLVLKVLVTLSPYQFLVEEIGGDGVEVSVLVPPGVSGHTFEPTPKEMLRVSQSAIWFRMGEPFEEKVLPVLRHAHPDLQVVDLRQGISLIYDHDHSHQGCPHCRGANSEDLHFWLSPANLEQQAKTVEAALRKLAPEQTFYLKGFLEKLSVVNDKVKKLTKEASPRVVLVSHPAYAYFCRDFGFQQLSIEVEGKDPSPKEMVRLIEAAKKIGIKKVFGQPQYSLKGATLIAKELGAKLIVIDPYAKNVLESLVEIATEFSN